MLDDLKAAATAVRERLDRLAEDMAPLRWRKEGHGHYRRYVGTSRCGTVYAVYPVPGGWAWRRETRHVADHRPVTASRRRALRLLDAKRACESNYRVRRAGLAGLPPPAGGS